MNVVFVVWAIAAFAMFFCGVYDVWHIHTSLRWLKRSQQAHQLIEDEPVIIVLLPVLREQRVISETLRSLASVKYPLQKLRIFVITTEKEIAQREQKRRRLIFLAKEIASSRVPTSLLVEKYLGVLPEDTLKEGIAVARQERGEVRIYESLLKLFQSFPTTMQVVDKEVALLNEQAGTPLFTRLHYPFESGYMHQQLEYAMEQLPSYLAAQGINREQTYLAVYNADSRLHPGSLESIASFCKNYYTQYGIFPSAMQQSAVFLENMNQMGSGLIGFLLKSSAILQTRWVLSHEIPRLRRQSNAVSSIRQGWFTPIRQILGEEFALCVAHGFFIRYDVLEKLRLFSIKTICDDLLWSFELCAARIPIYPVPLLESAESPTTLKSLLLQKRNWFLGYTEYLRYRRLTLHRTANERWAIELFTFHGLIRGMKWLLLSPTVLIAFLLPLLMHSLLSLTLTLFVFAVYGLLTYWLILSQFETLQNKSGGNWNISSLSMPLKICLTLCSLPAFLLESVGLWWCLFRRFYLAIAHQPLTKQKTER